MSLVAIFSMRYIASSGVFNLIFPPVEASNSCLDYGLNLSIKILSCISSENPLVGVFLVEAKLHDKSKVIQRCFDDNNDDNKR